MSLLRVLVARGLYRPDARALAEALLAQAALEPPPRIAGGGRGVQSRVDRAGSA